MALGVHAVEAVEDEVAAADALDPGELAGDDGEHGELLVYFVEVGHFGLDLERVAHLDDLPVAVLAELLQVRGAPDLRHRRGEHEDHLVHAALLSAPLDELYGEPELHVVLQVLVLVGLAREHAALQAGEHLCEQLQQLRTAPLHQRVDRLVDLLLQVQLHAVAVPQDYVPVLDAGRGGRALARPADQDRLERLGRERAVDFLPFEQAELEDVRVVLAEDSGQDLRDRFGVRQEVQQAVVVLAQQLALVREDRDAPAGGPVVGLVEVGEREDAFAGLLGQVQNDHFPVERHDLVGELVECGLFGEQQVELWSAARLEELEAQHLVLDAGLARVEQPQTLDVREEQVQDARPVLRVLLLRDQEDRLVQRLLFEQRHVAQQRLLVPVCGVHQDVRALLVLLEQLLGPLSGLLADQRRDGLRDLQQRVFGELLREGLVLVQLLFVLEDFLQREVEYVLVVEAQEVLGLPGAENLVVRVPLDVEAQAVRRPERHAAQVAVADPLQHLAVRLARLLRGSGQPGVPVPRDDPLDPAVRAVLARARSQNVCRLHFDPLVVQLGLVREPHPREALAFEALLLN